MKNTFAILLFVSLLFSCKINAQSKSFQELLKESQDCPISERVIESNYADNFSRSKKSTGLAMLYSFILPGMGELYGGNYNTGKYFTIADGALWITLSGMSAYGNNQRDNYIAFAKSFGGISANGKTDQFYADIAGYNSVDDFNNQQLLDRNFEGTYNADTHYWKWQNSEKRIEYKNTWTSSENAFNNIKFVAGALILNRVISVINAIRIVHAYNKSLNTELGWKVSLGLDKFAETMPTSLTVNLSTSF